MVTGSRERKRPARPQRRAGHSLPELIVAVTFLAVTVVAVGSTAVLGGRLTFRAVARQEATALAIAVLDSLTAGVAPERGESRVAGYRVAWEPDGFGGAPGFRVYVQAAADGPILVTVRGAALPAVPVLGDTAHGGSP